MKNIIVAGIIALSAMGCSVTTKMVTAEISLGSANELISESSNPSKWVRYGKDSKLVYAKDDWGNRIPDYSYAGYMRGGVKLPLADVKATIAP